MVAKVFAPTLYGIGLGILGTGLVLKAHCSYDSWNWVNLTMKACKLNKKYPNLQLISFIFALSIGVLSSTFGFAAGMVLGCFAAIILDVEHSKAILEENRRNQKY